MGVIVSMYDENKGTQKRKRRSEPYTKGEINKLIDSLCHPLGKKDKTFLVFDGILHAMVEQNPQESIEKFIKYNLPSIMKQKGKDREH
jgi:hypothetical protein